MFPERYLKSGLRDGRRGERNVKAHVSHHVQSGDVGRTHVSRVLRRHGNGRRRVDYESARIAARLLRHGRYESSR